VRKKFLAANNDDANEKAKQLLCSYSTVLADERPTTTMAVAAGATVGEERPCKAKQSKF